MNAGSPGPAITERAVHALREGAIVVDRSDRLRMTFSGEKAAESLNGLVANDVLSLDPGKGQYAAALTPRGKVLADVRIFAREDGLLVDTSAAAAPGWSAMIRKFVNPRLAKYRDISAETGDIGLFGANASHIARAALGDGLPETVPYAHATVNSGEAVLLVARAPDFGVEGYDIIGPREALDALRTKLIDAGATDDGSEVLEAARIEAGRPLWGVDMDDSMLAQEMDMDRLDAISFTKGCYTGQETVARVHFRGHVNRHLRGLRFTEAAVPPVGTELVDGDAKVVGTVRSGAISPRLGAIALAVIRREIEPATVLHAKWSGGALEATVESLPFS